MNQARLIVLHVNHKVQLVDLHRKLARHGCTYKRVRPKTKTNHEPKTFPMKGKLAGASLPESLAYRCVERELPAMALLDRDGVYGSARFHLISKTNGIRAHVGAELSVPALMQRMSKRPVFVACEAHQAAGVFLQFGNGRGCGRILWRSQLGFRNQTTKILIPGAVSDEQRVMRSGDVWSAAKPQARRWLEQLTTTFGQSNVYVELQRHFRPEQEFRNHVAIELAREMKLPLLATNGVLYATPADREVLDALTCIKHHCTLDEAGDRLQINSQRHVRNGKEMSQLFADLPEAIANTSELSSRLEFTLENLGYRFPKYPVPDGGSEIEFLRAQVRTGVRERYRKMTRFDMPISCARLQLCFGPRQGPIRLSYGGRMISSRWTIMKISRYS